LSELTVGLAPIPNLAQSIRDMAAPQVPLRSEQSTDHQEIFLPNPPTPNDSFLVHQPRK